MPEIRAGVLIKKIQYASDKQAETSANFDRQQAFNKKRSMLFEKKDRTVQFSANRATVARGVASHKA